MLLPPDLFPEARQRYYRFERLFRAQDTLADIVNEILDRHDDKLKLRDGEERGVSLLIAAAFGKGVKTFQAIVRLCLLGYGEDALILLRSSVNLLINTAYILADQKPTERAKDFLPGAHEVFKACPWCSTASLAASSSASCP